MAEKVLPFRHLLERFFAGLLKKTVPGLSFFALSLISVQQRRSHPVWRSI